MAEEQMDAIVDEAVASAETEEQKSTQTTEEVTENGTSTAEEQKKENGWYTSLPKEYREDAQQYGSMKEYLAALNENKGEHDRAETDEPKDDDWEGYLEGIRKESGQESPFLKILKESGVSVESSKKILESMEESSKQSIETAKASLTKNMHELWGDDYDVNKKAVKRGIASLGNGEMVKSMYESGLMYNPQVLHIVSMLGRSSSEVEPPEGHHSEKDNYDPMNPLGYKN